MGWRAGTGSPVVTPLRSVTDRNSPPKIAYPCLKVSLEPDVVMPQRHLLPTTGACLLVAGVELMLGLSRMD